MKTIAVLSDIHANAVALEAVLADLESVVPDTVVYLGDAAATGPCPREVIARLRSFDWTFVRGNCDDAILRYAAGDAGAPGDEHNAIDRWCAAQLSSADLEFIASFQPVVRFDTGGVEFCCYHGSPHSNLDEIVPNATDDELDYWFRGHRAGVFAGGHTHVQMIRRYRDGFAINPGSIGLPFTYLMDRTEIKPLWAEYAVVRIDGRRIGIELRRTPVDRGRVFEAVEQSDMPHKDWWSNAWA